MADLPLIIERQWEGLASPGVSAWSYLRHFAKLKSSMSEGKVTKTSFAKKGKKPTVVDLFSGCGGLSYGFERAGFDVLVGVDNWEPSLRTFKRNHAAAETMLADLSDLDPKLIEQYTRGRRVDVVIGGPPCQGFSISGKRMLDDPRNGLYRSFVKVVEHFQPKAFLLENVPNMIAMGKGKVRDSVLEDFTSLGYKVIYRVLLASDYGVPQNRRRVMFVGLKDGVEFEFPEAIFGEGLRQKITAGEALSDLSEDSVADGSPYRVKPRSDYQKIMRADSGGVHNHEITQHSEVTISTISLVPDGGNYKDLPTNLRDTRKVNIAWTRYCSTKPSLTIDTGHRHHFHYKWNRIPTVRESARLQSFPDNFIFDGSRTSQYKQVGNAVPPILAEAVAKKLKGYL